MAIRKKSIQGISIVEVLVVMAVLGIALGSFSGFASFNLEIATVLSQTVKANNLAQEAMEATRNFRDKTSWQSSGLAFLEVGTDYHPERLSTAPPVWDLILGSETIGGFDRKVVLGRVYRDGGWNDDIVETGGIEDQNTRKVTATVSWSERGRPHQVQLSTYLTNWRDVQ